MLLILISLFLVPFCDEFSPGTKILSRVFFFLLIYSFLLSRKRIVEDDFLCTLANRDIFLAYIIDMFQIKLRWPAPSGHTHMWTRTARIQISRRSRVLASDSEKRWNFVRACNAWLLKPPNPRIHTCPGGLVQRHQQLGEESALAVAPVVTQTAPQNHGSNVATQTGIESRIVDRHTNSRRN